MYSHIDFYMEKKKVVVLQNIKYLVIYNALFCTDNVKNEVHLFLKSKYVWIKDKKNAI